MTYNKKSIEDVEIKAGQKVFVRCDFNVPMKDGVITSDKRIVGALPTIKYLMGKGAKVILASHMGKPHSIFTPNFKLDKKEQSKVAALPENERSAPESGSRRQGRLCNRYHRRRREGEDRGDGERHLRSA